MKRYFNPVTKAILDPIQLKSAYPSTIFPSPFEPPAGWFEVQKTPKPVIDELAAYIVEGEPTLQGKSYHEVWTAVAFAPEVYLQNLATRKQATIQRIDADVDRVYAEVLGGRAIEYQRAEREALEYQAAGFTGDAPPFVASWASAAAISLQAAAENILAQANAWNEAASAIRASRLAAKQQVLASANAAAVSAVLSEWETTIAGIRTSLGLSN